MKTTIQLWFWVLLIFASTGTFALAQSSYSVVERGLNYRVLEKTNVINGTNQIHKITELATGMNYTNSSGQLVESSEQITLLPDGTAAATQGRHTVQFPADIYNGVLHVTTPDGQNLYSRPLCVCYDDGSNTVVVATLTNSIGCLTASNQITYPDCFSGIHADIVATYRRSGFECDLVFKGRPPGPDVFGLDASFATLELITEFFNTQDPQEIPAGSDDWYGLQDDTLKFGTLSMIRGKAFAFGNSSTNSSLPAPVYKTWIHTGGGRKFLVEQVPFTTVADGLNALPLMAGIEKSASNTTHLAFSTTKNAGQKLAFDPSFASTHPVLPAGHATLTSTNHILLAAADSKPSAGVLLDFTTLDTDQGDYEFLSGSTFLIEGNVYIGGVASFDGGAVIKYDSSGSITIGGSASFPSITDPPVVFTSSGDESVGESVDGGVVELGAVAEYHNAGAYPAALIINDMDWWDGEYWGEMQNARVYNAQEVVDCPQSEGTYTFVDCQFISCNPVLCDTRDGWDVEAEYDNCLFENVESLLSADSYDAGSDTITCNNCTVNGCSCLFENWGSWAFIYAQNCIFASVGGWLANGDVDDNPYGSSWCPNNGYYSSPDPLPGDSPTTTSVMPFESAASANEYLATSTFRNIGASFFSDDLETMTTYAPQDGGYPDNDGMPDLGYHYPTNEDSNFDGIPDWWIYYWFGNYTNTGSDLDNNGNTLLYDYQHGLNPTAPLLTMTVGLGDDSVGQCDVPFGLTNAMQVAAGRGQSLALKADGTVVAWGANAHGQGVVPAGLSGVAMISAGYFHDVALLTNGTVTAWGYEVPSLGYYLTNVPAGATNVIAISAGYLHTLALRSNTTVVAWGYDDGFDETNVPAALTNVTAIAAGFEFNLVVSNGTAVAWGDDSYFQCDVPAGLSNVVDVAAGPYHSLALRRNGTVSAWGDDFYGETDVPAGLSNVVAIAAGGDDETDTAYSMALQSDGAVTVWGDGAPVPFEGLTDVIGIAAGGYHALALRTWPPTPVITVAPTNQYQVPNGSVTFTTRGAGLYGVAYQWQFNGMNLSGATNAALTVTDVSSTNASSYSVVVTDTAGSIVSSNVSVELVTLAPPLITALNPPTNPVAMYPSNVVLNVEAWAPGYTNGFPLSYQWFFDGMTVPFANGATYEFRADATSAGIYTVLVSNSSGSTNASWQLTVLGTNGLEFLEQPTNLYQIAGGEVTFVAGALSTNPVTYQWQFNGTNILGATNTELVLTNTQLAQQGVYDVVASDSANTLASSNASFTLVIPPLITSLTLPTNQFAIYSNSFTLAVTVTAPGQTNGFPLSYQWQVNGTNISVPTLSYYTFAATNSGTWSLSVSNAAGSTNIAWQLTVVPPGIALGWGDDDYGESSPPAGLTNVISIAAGMTHSVAVQENGAVVQWGQTWANVPPDLTNALSVAAGYAHSIALRQDGTVEAWGDTNYGGTDVPPGITGVKAVAASWLDSLVLLTNGTVMAWGLDGLGFGSLTNVTGLTNITAISASTFHALALATDGTVQAWGDDTFGESDVPAGLSNVVAVAAGGYHSLALKADGTVTAWGWNNNGQCDVPAGLSNVMAIAAGSEHSVALLNNGTVVSWGENNYGQTNTPGLSQVKMIAAGGYQTLAGIFSPLVMYPVDVTKDLLLIYNTNSTDSATVLNYYLANRPGVSNANVLGIGCPGIYISNAPAGYPVPAFGVTNASVYETVVPSDFTNQILNPVLGWLNANPTKRPQYVILMLDVPSRVNYSATNAENFPFYGFIPLFPSVSVLLRTNLTGWQPFITHINMNGTNDCIGYIKKLTTLGTNQLPGAPFISASAAGYGNTNWYFDDTAYLVYGSFLLGLSAEQALIQDGVPSVSIIYTNVSLDNGYSNHIVLATNVAGYYCLGSHSSLGVEYPTHTLWSGNSGWWIIETLESFNGQRYAANQGTFMAWFSANSFLGSTNYLTTPVGAISTTDEPEGACGNTALYYPLWENGKCFAICAWAAKQSPYFQAVGDPFVTK